MRQPATIDNRIRTVFWHLPVIGRDAQYFFRDRVSKDFTLELTNLFLRNTRLKNVKSSGHLVFSGGITRYQVSPVAIQGDETAGQNRLTVAVKVYCENTLNEGESWDEEFSQFSDFDATSSLADVEEELIRDINEKLTQDIFNKTFSNW